jgi:hypothetical protein
MAEDLSRKGVKRRLSSLERDLNEAGGVISAVLERAGVSRMTWKRWIDGVCSPRVDNLHSVETEVAREIRRLRKIAERRAAKLCESSDRSGTDAHPTKPREHVNA